jgi:hypothetical protein
MAGNGPGFISKTALVGSRAVYYPFTIPKQLTDSADHVGQASETLIGGINAAVGNAYASLDPKGPAKWLLPLFGKIDTAVANSTGIRERNKTVFWTPLSEGFEGIGRAIGGPGAAYYLHKLGVDQPTKDQIQGLLQDKLFHFPADPGEIPAPKWNTGGDGGGSGGTGGAPAPDSQPTPETPPASQVVVPQGAAVDAGAGAGQVATSA